MGKHLLRILSTTLYEEKEGMVIPPEKIPNVIMTRILSKV